jgi:hypothetical protein
MIEEKPFDQVTDDVVDESTEQPVVEQEKEPLEAKPVKKVKRKPGRPKKKVTRGRGRKKVAKRDGDSVELTNTPREPRRRRRKGNIGDPGYNLAVPPIPGYELRWVNDYEGRDRLNMLYQNDWDFVEPKEIESWLRVEVGDETVTPQLQLGNKVVRKVGTEKTGKVLYAYLMKKRKEYYDADYAEQQELGPGAVERELKKGNTGVQVEYQHGQIDMSND